MNKAQHLLGVDTRFLYRGPYEVLERFLVFDTDDKTLSPKFNDIQIDRTRMADTKFEDENENE